MTQMHELRAQLVALLAEAGRLKREASDSDFYKTHVHLSNVEPEISAAIDALLSDPPLALRQGATQ